MMAKASSDIAMMPPMLPSPRNTQGSNIKSITATTIIMPSHSNIFLCLPLEIRDGIYRLLLKKDSPIRISIPRHQTYSMDLIYRTRTPCDSGVAVLWLCKHIQKEAITVFFKCNTFHVEVGYPLKAFVNFIPREKRAMIRKLQLKVNRYRAFSPAASESGIDQNVAYRPESTLVSSTRLGHNSFIDVDLDIRDTEDFFGLNFNFGQSWRTRSAMFGTQHPGLFLGTATDIATFRSFYRSVASVFPGVEELDICFAYGGYQTNFIAPKVKLAHDATITALAEMVRLFSHGSDSQVRRIGMKNDASDDNMVAIILMDLRARGRG